ncbi:MAG TPA: SpoIIE family protein phosphatase [Opitutaceae bacterium]|nr:SpoIIE family protein phosphatase [Opitutaceae bacterium]
MADLRVLLVDDEDLILHVLKEFFRQRGDHCDTATNGTEALRFVEDRIYDLVLSDISMPGMDGLELIRRVKLLQPHVVCILMSGLGTRRDIISALKIGVFDFIDKPIPDLAALTMVIDRAGESSRLTKERDLLLENLKHQNAKLEYSLLRLHEAFGQLRRQEEALESDLLKAQRVQRKFLPSRFPRVEGLELFGYYAPCEQLGGDFFGYISLPNGQIGVYLVDVAGHGVSAAMITVNLREVMRSRHRAAGGNELFQQPEKVLKFLNEALLEENFDPPIFVSMIYAVFDPNTGQVRLASAGHPAPIMATLTGELKNVMESGPVLGTQYTTAYTTATLQLDEGDGLLFYSDGLTDARSTDGTEFSAGRLRETMAELHQQHAGDVGSVIERQLLQHVNGITPSDDVTFLVVTRTKPANNGEGSTVTTLSGLEMVEHSVKFIMPEKIRHVRTDTRGRVEGGWREKTCIIRLSGILGWQLAPAVREMIRQGKDRAYIPIRVDLAEAETMDSTMLGLLLQHANDLILHQPGDRIIGQLHEMGVLPLFNISHDRCEAPEIPMAVAPNDTQQACSELILSAHEALMEASASNRQKFKEVVDTLRANTSSKTKST